jgi:hypothetical protein
MYALLVAAYAAVAIPAAAQTEASEGVWSSGGPASLNAMVDWQFSVRLGVEKPVAEFLSVKGDLGVSVFGVLVADALLVVHTTRWKEGPRVDILVGVPNAGAPVTFEGAMVSVGASIRPSLPWGDTRRIGFRIGAGYPFFFERDKPIIRDIRMPLEVWPDAGVEIAWQPRGWS